MLAKINRRARHAPENIGGSRSRCLANRGYLAFRIISDVTQTLRAHDPTTSEGRLAPIAAQPTFCLVPRRC